MCNKYSPNRVVERMQKSSLDIPINPPPEPAPANLLVLALIALISGALVGLVGAAFCLMLRQADQTRGLVIAWARQWPEFGWLIPVVAAAGLVMIARWLVQRFAPLASGSGVQHVEAVMQGEAEPALVAVLPVKFIGGTLAIGSGLALGREGPTVQMGAVIGTLVSKGFAAIRSDIGIVQSAAAGAGLAVAFNAPIGGVAFVFEELSRRFESRLMVATLAACGAAMIVARTLLGDPPEFQLGALPAPTPASLALYLILGVLLGVLGAAYNRAVIRWLNLFNRFERIPVIVRVAGVGGVVGLVAWFEPRLVGGGESIVQSVIDGQFTLQGLAWLFAARWLLGTFSYSAGTPGGLFSPLLLVGATLGALFGETLGAVLGPLFDETLSRFFGGSLQSLLPDLIPPTSALAVVGMAAFFTAVVRAPLTGLILITEMTANTTLLLPMLTACLSASIVPPLLGSAPIYDTLRQRLLHPGQRRA
jgi:CIC family chloride channel protein